MGEGWGEVDAMREIEIVESYLQRLREELSGGEKEKENYERALFDEEDFM